MTYNQFPPIDKGTADKVGFIRVSAVPLSFPEKRLFAVPLRK